MGAHPGDGAWHLLDQQGRPVDVEARLVDMLRRHGPDSPNARAHAERAPVIRAAVTRTQRRLTS